MAEADRAWIEHHIPHQGKMCLLDRVVAWDDECIHCTTGTHHDPENPLRDFGRLAAVCGAEYGAQATAIHGALLREQSTASQPGVHRVQKGYLVSIRDLDVAVERLDEFAADLDVRARRFTASTQGAQYDINVLAGHRLLLTGRVMIKFLA